LATTLAHAKQVLTDPHRFDFPGDVSRSGDLSESRGDTRSGHSVFAPLTPAQVAVGVQTFAREWAKALSEHDQVAAGEPYDAMLLLRRPVALSTTAAVLTSTDVHQRELVSSRVLDWIDALGPVIAARRPPGRWSRVRRAERDARIALHDALAATPGLDGTPSELATLLAAGIQVPIAAGSWLLAWLAEHPTSDVDPVHAVWETVRLTPPTWITARVTTEDVEIDGVRVPSGHVVMVSPLFLGRSPELVPGSPDRLADFDPGRWRDEARRPGAWLPFGAGPHACPGRNLGMAQLVHLAQWGLAQKMAVSEQVHIDQSRGIAPQPCRFTVAQRREAAP
jgi:cytochrome P450